MSRAGIRWLYDELPELVRGGVLGEDEARRLREHYGEPGPGAASRRTVLVVLGVLGAALVGAGIILIFAHNWGALPRTARAAISMGLLVSCQALAAWALAARRASRAWTEASSVLLSFAVAAAIALISQTYHIPGDLDHFLFACLLLVLPLVYVTGSRATAIVFWAGLVVWAASLMTWSGAQDHHRPYWVWILAASSAPFLVALARRHGREKPTVLVMWVVALALPILMLCALERSRGTVRILFCAGILAGLYALGTLGEARGPGRGGRQIEGEGTGAPWRKAFVVVGFLGIAVFGMVFSFKDLWPDSFSTWGGSWTDASFLANLAVTILGGGAGLTAALRAARGRRWHEALAASVFLVAAAGWLVSQRPGMETGAAALLNLYLLALGAATLAHGMRAGEFATANAGLLVIAAVFVMRFFDTELSFLARGMGFIALGLGTVGLNVWLARRRWRTEP